LAKMDTHLKHFYLIVLVLTLSFSIAAGEFHQSTNKFLTKQWNTENGLPQNTVTSILQTRDGYLWVATLGGLTRFDGLEFTIFNSTNTPQLKENRFVTLFEDDEGLLWITSEYGTIYYYENDSFKALSFPGSEKENYFIEHETDGIIIQNQKAIRKYEFSKERGVGPLVYEYDIKDLNPGLLGKSVVVARDAFWMSNNIGQLIRIDRETSQATVMSSLFEGELLGVIAKEELNGGLWVVTDKSIGRIIDNKYEVLHRMSMPNKVTNSAIFTGKDKEFWVVRHDSLLKFSKSGKEETKLEVSEDFAPRCLAIDYEGNLWVGTSTSGLYRLKTARVKTYGKISNGKVFETRAVYEDSKGDIWVGTSGLLKLHNYQPSFYLESQDFGSNPMVSSITEDKTGKLWLATLSKLFYFADDKPVPYDLPSIFPKTLAVNSLFFDDQNNLWVGSKDGVGKFGELENKFLTVADGLVNNWVNRITQTRDGKMWFGTINGMSSYENGKFTNFTTVEGLSGNNVREIYEDQEGTLWIGTYGGGINRYRDGKFVPISSAAGLPEDIASRILVDDEDNFWVLGNRGIYTINRHLLNDYADGKIKNVPATVYDKGDGMITSEGNGINQYSGWKSKDGTLWFTMINGVVAIDPKTRSKTPPRVYIEGISVEKKPLEKKDGFVIEYNQGNIEIGYTGLHFAKPENVQFRYKLEGFDKDWNFVGSRRTAYFSYLPPGDYLFKVEALSADGVWSSKFASIPIKVTTPFWRTLWFYFALFVLLLAIVAIIYQMRLRKLEQEKLRQQQFAVELINAHETERKRIASDLHDGLGQNLLVIKNWTLIALKSLDKPADTLKHLEEIKEFTSQAIEDTRNISANLMPLHLKRFGLSETLKNMILRVEKATKIEIGFEIDPLNDLLSEKYELSIYRIVQECLNNVVKHSETSKAFISVNADDDKVIGIMVRDFGKGFEVKKVTDSVEHSHGFGLYNLVERVKLMHGQIDIKSKPAQGTTIEVRIPLNDFKNNNRFS
jgi:signal transduction histidine kinase/ligand-binding sensor domain-containing protein